MSRDISIRRSETYSEIKPLSDRCQSWPQWGDWVRTPLDFNRPDEVAVAYVLLPKTWAYSAPAMSLKTKAKPWKHPQINLPKNAVSKKIAILYRAEQNFRSKTNCRYEFNLHVTISQKENGEIL